MSSTEVMEMIEHTEQGSPNSEFTAEIAQGVQALRAGHRQAARQLFARAVRKVPDSATAWYWLSRAVSDERQRQDCLARVAQLDKARAQRVESDKCANRQIDKHLHCAQAQVLANRQIAFRKSQPTNRNSELGTRNSKLETRHTRTRRWLLALLALSLIALTCAATPIFGRAPARAVALGRAANHEQIEASGVIRAQEVLLSSEYGGQIEAILYEEGEPVQAGDVLVQLDTSLIDAQIEAAKASLALAQAGLDKVRAGARPGQIAVAEAQLAQAQAVHLAATQAVSDTSMLVERPQDIQLQINVLHAQLQAADHKLAQALALKDAAEIGKDTFAEAQRALRNAGGPGERRFRVQVAQGSINELIDRIPPEIRDQLPAVPADGTYTAGSTEIEIRGDTFTLYRWVTVNLNLPFEAHLTPNKWWQAWIGVNAAAAERDGIVASLNQLYAQRSTPQEMQAQADQALALLAQAEAQVGAAQARVDGLKAGATPEQIAAIEAKVAQAQAALDSLLTQRAQMEVASPIDGMVVAISAHQGEVAAKGATLVTIADLDTVYLTVYLPETHIGQIHLGQTAQVTVDSFAHRRFEGTVSHIADTAEFTPRNISTKEERVNLVFAIEVSLANRDGSLKPGMPAEAIFGSGK
jgi:multidrug resistance efflux pump